MGIEDASMRNGRALSDLWADSVVVRPRTTQQHITVNKRLVLGFAISILTLIVVTAIAITLSVSFERCAAESSGVLAANGSSNSKWKKSRDGNISHRDSEDEQQPWRHLRLPATLRPRHYDLRLSVYMENFTFSGEVNIEFECVHSTKFIVLHTDRLEVDKVLVYSDSKKAGAMRIQRRFHYQPKQVYVIALHREMKPLRTYKINITFHVLIEHELLGFFRSSYVLNGERRFLAVTQFSLTHARKAFPCFDEPIYKATFRVSLKHESSYQSLSNMPVEASTSDERPTFLQDISLCMSTYYLHLQRRSCRQCVVIRLYARPDAIQSGSGDYALHITKRLLQFYQDYFKVKYSLPKLDLLAVPKHPYAAMENWGLSVFVEQKILLDPDVSSFSYQMELCHQWFGDLEGFAHYFEYIGEKQRFLTDVLHEVMLLDGLASSHPISQEVFEATDIDRVFDWIAYKKGAALIRMLANVMGQPLFQRGLNDYLMTHMYGNAARDDLWNKFSEAMQREGKDINITQVMDRWTLQMGYPVVTISKNDSLDNSVTISQEHFIYDTDAKIQNPELFNKSFQWQIPLTLAVGNSSHISTETIIWVSNKTETHRVGHVDGEMWLLGNINQTGYFRVNYDLHNWRLLIQQLMTNPTIISVGNRVGLIDDVFNLARAGYLPQNVPLQMISYLSQETEFLPWHAASRALYQLDKLLDRTEDHSLFSVSLISDQFGVCCILTLTSAIRKTQELQREVMMLACSFGNKHCHRQSVSLISDWISTISEKKVLLEALTCSDNIFLLNRLLNLSLTSDLEPDQDVIDVIIHVGCNPLGRHLAWRYFHKKWDILNSRHTNFLHLIHQTRYNEIVNDNINHFCFLPSFLQLKEFILTSGGESAPAFARAVEIVQANVKWHILFKQQFNRWLRKAPDG
uniref:Aminopeptidase n=1 Tax=Cyprinus carpio carpio TaxID=630221 RepID=A0A9J7XQW4_CYPCA